MKFPRMASALLVGAVGLGWPGLASATVYRGSTTVPAPASTPSLNGPAYDPTTQAEFVQNFSAAYDDAAGSVALSFNYYNASQWGQTIGNDNQGAGPSSAVSFTLDSTCESAVNDLTTGDSPLDNPPPGVLSGEFSNTRGPSSTDANGNTVPGPVTGVQLQAVMGGYNGQVTVPASYNGTFSGVISNAAFQHRPWPCLAFANGRSSNGTNVWTVPLAIPQTISSQPRLLTGLVKPAMAVRPAVIIYTGDGSGVLGGFDGRGPKTKAKFPRWAGHLRWTSWTRGQALATGAAWIDNCTPDCATGTFHPYAVRVRASAPVADTQGGHFTRLVLRYRYHGHSYTDHRQIFKASYGLVYG